MDNITIACGSGKLCGIASVAGLEKGEVFGLGMLLNSRVNGGVVRGRKRVGYIMTVANVAEVIAAEAPAEGALL